MLRSAAETLWWVSILRGIPLVLRLRSVLFQTQDAVVHGMVLIMVEVHVPVAEIPIFILDGIVDGLQGFFNGMIGVFIPGVHTQANLWQGIERASVSQDVVDLVVVAS